MPLEDEEQLTLAELGQRINPQTPFRTVEYWALNGVLNRVTGERVFLESRKHGGVRLTSLDAYKRFDEAVNRKE